MCAACIVLSGVLWLRGLWSILEWGRWKWSGEGRTVSGETKRHGCPTAMPGQERGSNWESAWEHVAKVRNFRVRHERDSEHFHVAPLLHSTTGLDMEHLCFLTKKKHDNQQKNKHDNQQQQQQQQGLGASETGTSEAVGDLREPHPEATGGYLFPVQVQRKLIFTV